MIGVSVEQLREWSRINRMAVMITPDGSIQTAAEGEEWEGRAPNLFLAELAFEDVLGTPDRPSALATQVGGSHYKSMAIQPMEYSMANKLDACQHTVIKYVTRFREKGGVQDLMKARHVIDMLVEFETKAGRGPSAANDDKARAAAKAHG